MHSDVFSVDRFRCWVDSGWILNVFWVDSKSILGPETMGGFWRDQNPDISAPTSKQVGETTSTIKLDDDTIQAVLDRDDNIGHLIPSKTTGKQTVSNTLL